MYPFQLCEAILRGTHNQLKHDRKLIDGAIGMQALFDEDAYDEMTYTDVATGEVLLLEDQAAAEAVFKLGDSNEQFIDSVSGQPLQEKLVRAARQKELE